MDKNQSEITREISVSANVLKPLRGFCIVILKHKGMHHIIAFKVSICLMD